VRRGKPQIKWFFLDGSRPAAKNPRRTDGHGGNSIMLAAIEEKFAAGGRTPKGCAARRAIFRATRAEVAEAGIRAASLDAIADRAGLSQAALRHYFASRDDLLSEFFTTATGWFQDQVAAFFVQADLRPRDRLERCIGWHLEYMEAVETAFWLEASAYWLRQSSNRRTRDAWYRWLVGQYGATIGEILPTLGQQERERRAYCMLTLVLGSWITHGRGSAVTRDAAPAERRQLLVDAALDMALN
jgi:AcrR family transcriptional regulator